MSTSEATHTPRATLSARIGALMFLTGAAFCFGSTYAPHAPHGDERAQRDLALGQVVAACAMLGLPKRWHRVVPGAVVAGAVIVVTISIYFNGERFGDRPTMTEFFYTWPAVYVGYFFRRRAVPIFIAFTGTCYGVLLFAMKLGENSALRWQIAMTVVAGLAVASHLIRTQVNRLVGRLEETARTDSLTGMPNRRAFDERFDLELARAARTGEPLSLLLGDVDDFKKLNDRFGHTAGDIALAEVGRVLMSECRAIDVPARIGGEEFAVVLPGTEAEGAVITADRLRDAVSTIRDGDGRPLTISFGVAVHARDGLTKDSLLGAADRALYAAKRAGRDRTILSEGAALSAVAGT